MASSKKELIKLAHLVRLEFDELQFLSMHRNMENILQLVGKLENSRVSEIDENHGLFPHLSRDCVFGEGVIDDPSNMLTTIKHSVQERRIFVDTSF